MKPKQRIWILEDEKSSQFVYEEILRPFYELSFYDRIEALDKAIESQNQLPDLLIADIFLDRENFIRYLQNRATKNSAFPPFLVISCVDDAESLRECFKMGALDFLTKPFAAGELLVKLERLFLGGNQVVGADQVKWNGIQLNRMDLRISNEAGLSVQLTMREYQIVSMLFMDTGKTHGRSKLMERVWGSVSVGVKNLDVHISNLRKKLNPLGLRIDFLPPDSFKLIYDPTS